MQQTQTEAFRQSSGVFVAKVISVERTALSLRGSGKHEVAKLQVLEAFKGKWQAGNVVRFENDVFESSGMCDMSIVNDPPWAVDTEDKPLKFSGLWLMYVWGEEPFQHSLCSWSKPLELALGELGWLYKRGSPLPPRKQ